MGYPEGVKGYRLWARDERWFKMIFSRNVIFNEADMPCLNKRVSSDVPEWNKDDETRMQVCLDHSPGLVEEEQVENEVEGENDGVTGVEGGEHDLVGDMVDSLGDYQLARDRARREIREPMRMGDYQSFAIVSYQNLVFKESKPCEEAVSCRQSNEWLGAMEEEMRSLVKNNTWTLVPKPKDKSLVDCKWVYSIKEGSSSKEPLRFKARLVAKGFTQKSGIDYDENFSHVVKYTTISVMLAFVAQYVLELEQMDVKTTFLHGDLDETIYMILPHDFIDSKKPKHVCLLNRSLYGLKQSPRQQYIRFDYYVSSIGFVQSAFDHCLYFKRNDSNDVIVYLLLCVDDMLYWIALKWLLRYLKCFADLELHFKSCKEDVVLKGFVDSDYASNKDNRKSTTAYVFTLCSTCISWKSQLQSIVALSTTEVVKESLWLKCLLCELNALHNPVFHDRTKHIDVRLHFIRDIVHKESILFEKIPTQFNPMDMGAKVLPLSKFKSCLQILKIDTG